MELRKERKLTQIQMQMLTGIDQSDYSKLERGKRYYTFEQCRRIALALNTSMDYLAELTDEKSPMQEFRTKTEDKGKVTSSKTEWQENQPESENAELWNLSASFGA